MNGILILIGAALFLLGFWTGHGWRQTKPSHPNRKLLEAERFIGIPAKWEDE